ncbi:hypothetical protein GQ55_2G431700 [Panicum hallii var. hallii]|uniref:Uncharacterized protein n=1 Tax=Panicum hallii var. hallii TaxID=1504633 RepID=A0A2T7EYI4_9POAL|nr:hypothetical protein GQ55_2G431700 [Panicum hallii var. hallii]
MVDGSCSRGGTEMALQQLQLLPWLDQGVKAAAAGGGSATAKTKTAKKRRSAAQAGVARGMKALLSGVVEMVGKRFECSVPAAKFGHVAYIR